MQYKPFPLKVGNKLDKMAYIGVYGTLKRGQRANGMLATGTFIGEFKVEIPFQMYNLGSFPALVASEENHLITLEVYEVNDEQTLRGLDRYEGYPNLYQKSTVQVETMDVTIYTMIDKRHGGELMESGNWE